MSEEEFAIEEWGPLAWVPATPSPRHRSEHGHPNRRGLADHLSWGFSRKTPRSRVQNGVEGALGRPDDR
jgi:hypothetical protein